MNFRYYNRTSSLYNNKKWKFFTHFLLIFSSQSWSKAENIHHNLPDDLEIIDPKSLGLSGTDLENFLGNVKLLPIEGNLGVSGSPKTQILTVGFDGNEKLNLDDFESLSTAGLADSDKHVAEMAFKKFQNFFKNPESAKDFDKENDGSTEYASYSTTTQPSATTLEDDSKMKTKHRKRVRIGKRPMFSSTFRTVPFGNFENSQSSSTERNIANDFQSYTQVTRPITTEYRQGRIQVQNFQNPQQLGYSTHEPNFGKFPSQPLAAQSNFENNVFASFQIQGEPQLEQQKNQQNYITFPQTQYIQQQPIENSVQQVAYNVKNSGQVQGQGVGQRFESVRKPTNQNPVKINQQEYPYVPKQQHFMIQAPQTTRPFPAVKQQLVTHSHLKPQTATGQQQQHQNTQQIYRVPTHQHKFSGRQPQNFIQQTTPQSQTLQNYQASRNRQQKQIPNPTQSQQPQIQYQQNILPEYPQHQQILTQGPQQQLSNFQLFASQFPKQKQLLPQQFQHQESQQQYFDSGHGQNQIIQNYDSENQVRQKFVPSQADPLHLQEYRQFAPSPAVQVIKIANEAKLQASANIQLEQAQTQQQVQTHAQSQSPYGYQQHVQQLRLPPLSTTPKSITMSGIFQITPSIPLIPLSTVENAMSAHKSRMYQLHEIKTMKQHELTQNHILGNNPTNQRFPQTKPNLKVPGQEFPRFPPPAFPPPNIELTFPLQGPPAPVQEFKNLRPTPFPPHRQATPPNNKQTTNNKQSFQQHPISSPNHLPPFIPEPSRQMHAPPPPSQEFSQPPQMVKFNQIPPGNFHQRFPPHPLPPIMSYHNIRNFPDNQSRHPPTGQSPVNHSPRLNPFNHHRQERQHQQFYEHNTQSQGREQAFKDQSSGANFSYQSVSPPQNNHFHTEANDYARNLGLNIQSISTVPLIKSFVS